MTKEKLTKLEKYWILYDVANSAFILLVATIVPIYFNSLAEAAGRLTENRIHKPARRIPCCKKEHAYSHKKRKLWKSFGEKGAVTWKLFRMMQRNWYRCG